MRRWMRREYVLSGEASQRHLFLADELAHATEPSRGMVVEASG